MLRDSFILVMLSKLDAFALRREVLLVGLRVQKRKMKPSDGHLTFETTLAGVHLCTGVKRSTNGDLPRFSAFQKDAGRIAAISKANDIR